MSETHPTEEWLESDIDRLLEFLPIFSSRGFVAGEVVRARIEDGSITPGWVQYNSAVGEFTKAIAKSSTYILVPGDEYGEVLEYGRSPAKLREASFADIRRWLQVFTRGERFCDGFMLDEFTSGNVVAVLNRLNDLRHEVH